MDAGACRPPEGGSARQSRMSGFHTPEWVFSLAEPPGIVEMEGHSSREAHTASMASVPAEESFDVRLIRIQFQGLFPQADGCFSIVPHLEHQCRQCFAGQ